MPTQNYITVSAFWQNKFSRCSSYCCNSDIHFVLFRKLYLVSNTPYDDFTSQAVANFADAIEEAREIWPEMVRREVYREWAQVMKALELLDRRTRAAVLATLLPIVAVGEELGAETSLRNAELLFVALLESAKES